VFEGAGVPVGVAEIPVVLDVWEGWVTAVLLLVAAIGPVAFCRGMKLPQLIRVPFLLWRTRLRLPKKAGLSGLVEMKSSEY
jgi:hypothetical protein